MPPAQLKLGLLFGVKLLLTQLRLLERDKESACLMLRIDEQERTQHKQHEHGKK